MRGRVMRMGNLPESIAIIRGPVLLARDRRLDAVSVDEISTPAVDKDGYLPLEPVRSPDSFWMSFRAPFIIGSSREEEHGKPVPLLLCDYASAGNTFSDASRYRVWLPQLIDPQKLTAK